MYNKPMEQILVRPSEAYELIDSGNGLRLERLGQHTIVRPEPTALWQPTTPNHPAWINPNLRFDNDAPDRWHTTSPDLLKGWPVLFEHVKLLVKPTPFRHLGVFPEQVANWEWIRAQLTGKKDQRVLNLFGYTGGASIAAAQASAAVTHVDAAPGTVRWASDNARLSHLGDKGIQWIVDDAASFVRREVRRNRTYDLIILDPPVFGRGNKGQVWRLEEDLGPLLEDVAQLFTKQPRGLVINFYATALYPEALARLAEDALKAVFTRFTLSSLSLQESESKKPLQTGYCLRCLP